ncbi:DJ-1/PfpI family protein [Candidatus Acetothermia bacterium]|jgi:4-methyl-5(b-hydroxyethyl)-thiazole monophosphate biosynthesis|nr:DJ-1/PfpI family protein [Candidatus Acetothermia bacterium]
MRVLVPLVDGFEEIEFSTIVDILRRAELDVITAGLREGAIDGAHGVKVIPDTLIDRVSADDFDIIVLPGGYPGFVNLGKDERVLRLVREMHGKNKYVAAICGAPAVLAKAGILAGRKSTIHPGVKNMLTGAKHVNERVVVDGRIITSQGPGTAMEFSMKLVELLVGQGKVKQIKEAVLANL